MKNLNTGSHVTMKKWPGPRKQGSGKKITIEVGRVVPRTMNPPGRNQPCLCGSEKKAKHCCFK